MSHDPTAGRLFPDMAASPTRTERAGTRRYWDARQSTLTLDTDDPSTIACAACAGPHASSDCPHGTALALPTGDTP